MSKCNRLIYVIDGIKYGWNGWSGCQLESYEWFKPKIGYERTIDLHDGKEIIRLRPFSFRREWLKYRITWTIPLRGTIDEENTQIRRLKERLKALP